MKAYLRQTRVSPKKANLIASLVRNKKVTEAIDILKFTPKKTAIILKKLIESAAANAENNFKQNKDNLYIKEIIVNGGPTYKRRIYVSKGRAHPILKRTSHIRVTLAAQPAAQPAKEKGGKTETKEVKEAKPKKQPNK